MLQHTSACVSIRQHESARSLPPLMYMPQLYIRQNASAYVSMRQHTSARSLPPLMYMPQLHIRQNASACVSIRLRGLCRRLCICPPAHRMRQHTSASIRQNASAEVSIRQHTSAYLHIDKLVANNCVSGLHVVKVNGHHLRAPPHAYVAYVSTHQHTPSIRQHTPANISVSIRQHNTGGPAGEGHLLSALVCCAHAPRCCASMCTFVPVKRVVN